MTPEQEALLDEHEERVRKLSLPPLKPWRHPRTVEALRWVALFFMRLSRLAEGPGGTRTIWHKQNPDGTWYDEVEE